MAIADSSQFGPALSLPALVLRVWGRAVHQIDELVARHPYPPVSLGEGRYAFLPEPGDPAVVEAGLHLARKLLQASPPAHGLRFLVHPARVRGSGARLAPEYEELDEELTTAPPELRPGKIYLTGHSVHELESRWVVEQRGAYRRPSGRSVTLFELDGHRPDLPPWRNPEVLGRYPHPVERTVGALVQQQVAAATVLAVTGPLGSGKTRTVVEAIRRANVPWLWASAWPARSGGPRLEAQIAQGLLDLAERRSAPVPTPLAALRERLPTASGWSAAPLPDVSSALLSTLATLGATARIVLVLDDLERADESGRELVARLCDIASRQTAVHVVLVGRAGAWADSAPVVVAVPPMEVEEADLMWHQLVAPLKVPEPVLARLQEDAAGVPFVAEELLLQLARRRALRQLYGTFFYAGPEDVTPDASERLVRHVLSDVQRLGPQDPPRLLAHAHNGLDPTLPAFSAVKATADWQRPFVAGGLLREERAGSRPRVSFVAPAFAAALRTSVAGRGGDTLRELLARGLGGRDAARPATWDDYQLVAGQPQGIPLLLELLKEPPASVAAETLFEATRLELERHRARGGDESTELELLWGLLRLARRVGALRNLEAALDRALALTTGDPKRQLTLWSLKAEHAQNAGQLELAEESLRNALALAQGENPSRQTLLLIQLGKLMQLSGRLDEAGRLFSVLAARLFGGGNAALAATCRFYHGNLLLQQQRLDEALQAHQEALATREAAQLHAQVGQSLSAIGSAQLSRGDYAASLATYERSLAVLEKHGAPTETSYALLGLARVLNRLGASGQAIQRARRGVELRAQLDDAVGEALARLDLAESHLLNLELPEALRQARRAHFQLALLRQERHMAQAEQLLGRILLQQKSHESARQRLESALRLHLDHRLLQGAIHDQRWLLEQALELADTAAVESLARNTSLLLESVSYPERGEHVDLRLFQAHEWLRSRGAGDAPDPLPFLRRAHAQLLRRAEPFDAALRHNFLFQVPQNREIVELAAARGVARQGALKPPPPPPSTLPPVPPAPPRRPRSTGVT